MLEHSKKLTCRNFLRLFAIYLQSSPTRYITWLAEKDPALRARGNATQQAVLERYGGSRLLRAPGGVLQSAVTALVAVRKRLFSVALV